MLNHFALEEMLRSVIPMRNSQAHYSYFRQKALTDELDRGWQPHAWLPPIDFPEFEGEVSVETIGIKILPDGNHLVSAIRHDLDGPYPTTALFADSAAPSDSEPEAAIDSGPVS